MTSQISYTSRIKKTKCIDSDFVIVLNSIESFTCQDAGLPILPVVVSQYEFYDVGRKRFDCGECLVK